MRFERQLSAPNEVFAADGEPFSLYRPILEEMEWMGVGEWDRRRRRAHAQMLEEQRGLGIAGPDKTHPTDYVPRLVPAADWTIIERGLAQRMLALNEFLRRLEAGKEEVVPREVIESSILYEPKIPDSFGSIPNRQMGFDLVAARGPGPRVHRHRRQRQDARRHRADVPDVRPHRRGALPRVLRITLGEIPRRHHGAFR
jgi:uncharacterized circularly permuted ATP-grasp superfamily protein